MKKNRFKCPKCGSHEITIYEVLVTNRTYDAQTGKVFQRASIRFAECLGNYFECRECGNRTEEVDEDWRADDGD
jgi:predicted nucleic-acid-binding Zn-ribbon protein